MNLSDRADRGRLHPLCAEADILVNNSGGPPVGDFRAITHEAWLAALEANMLSAIELINAALPGMTERLFGRILNVTINNLLPGQFETERLSSNHERFASMRGVTLEAFQDASRKDVPARRFGRLAEFGAYAAFLCSAHCGFVTGQNVLLDGGQYPGLF